MKTRLHRIEIRNFKAFKSFALDLDGKHLLVYGPNGSGKSSLYWALHCFLQSSRKTTPEMVKYFDPSNPQNLLNIHEDPSVNPGEIALTLRQMSSKTDTTYRLNLVTHGTRNVPIVRTGDLASDFITYRFFFGFSHFRNSQRFNLWPLFEKEILPFCVDSGGKDPLAAWLEIKGVDPNPTGARGLGGQRKYDRFRSKVNAFATLLPLIIDRISNEAQRFYDKHFAEAGDPKVSIKLGLRQNASYPADNSQSNELKSPILDFGVQVDGKTIQRPQVFLNEAKLTQLALSVRFAASLVNLHQSDFKLLVLDDLLVSLDMSNRMKVIDILMSATFKDYQKIILTHDRGLFEETRRAIGPLHSEWQFVEYKQKGNGFTPEPVKSNLEVAQDYLEDDALELCGNHLRKHAEDALAEFLSKAKRGSSNSHILDKGKFASLGSMIQEAQKVLQQNDGQEFAKLFQYSFSDEELSSLLAPHGVTPDSIVASHPTVKAEIYKTLLAARLDLEAAVSESISSGARKRMNAVLILSEVEKIKDRILNPASHAGVSPIFRKEAEDAIQVITQLEGALKAALATI